jgi:hypothetical protein
LEIKFSSFGLWFCVPGKSKGILTTQSTMTMAREAHGKTGPDI